MHFLYFFHSIAAKWLLVASANDIPLIYRLRMPFYARLLCTSSPLANTTPFMQKPLIANSIMAATLLPLAMISLFISMIRRLRGHFRHPSLKAQALRCKPTLYGLIRRQFPHFWLSSPKETSKNRRPCTIKSNSYRFIIAARYQERYDDLPWCILR